MNKRTHKLMSLLLTIVMVLGLLPAMSMTASAAVITDVNFTIREPIGTEYPSTAVTCDNDKVRVAEVQWTKGDTGTGKVLGEDDAFKAGDWYTVKVYFSFTDNYTVAVNYTATLNGNAVSLENADGMPGIYVTEYAFQAKHNQLAYVPEDSTVQAWTTLTCDDDDRAFTLLKQFLEEDDGNVYAIRLGGDLKHEVDWNVKTVFSVHGKKYLDLNGHDLYVKRDDGWTSTMFEILADAELVVVDSAGGGTIRYDGYIFDGADYDSGHLAVRHVFDVYGKLTINGGKIMGGGRSKQQWLSVATREGHRVVYGFNGFVRNQVNGCGVIVENGGELVVNGGDVTGRGYEYLTSGSEDSLADYEPAAAIRILAGAKVTLNDGFFKGYGGADVIDLRAYVYQVDVIIRAGVFQTHKVDKVRLPDATITSQYFGGTRDNYMDGTYGWIGLESEWIAPDAKVLIGGEEAAAGEDGLILYDQHNGTTYTIEPKENIPSRLSYIRPVTGVTLTGSTTSDTGNTSSGAWTMGTTGILEAVFDENDYYWEQGILDNDCIPDTRQKSYIVWEIRDYFRDKHETVVFRKVGPALHCRFLIRILRRRFPPSRLRLRSFGYSYIIYPVELYFHGGAHERDPGFYLHTGGIPLRALPGDPGGREKAL